MDARRILNDYIERLQFRNQAYSPPSKMMGKYPVVISKRRILPSKKLPGKFIPKVSKNSPPKPPPNTPAKIEDTSSKSLDAPVTFDDLISKAQNLITQAAKMSKNVPVTPSTGTGASALVQRHTPPSLQHRFNRQSNSVAVAAVCEVSRPTNVASSVSRLYKKLKQPMLLSPTRRVL